MKLRLRSLSRGETAGCLFCFSLALLLSGARFLTRAWEDLILSARFFGQGMVQYQEPVVITIDEESFRSTGSWPWPRSVYATALHKLNQEGPAVIGIDLLFQIPDPENDPLLSAALEKMEVPVVLGTELDLYCVKRFWDGRWSDNGEKPSLFPTADKGYLNLIPDSDGMIRKWPLYSGATRASFSERVYQLATGKNPPSVRCGVVNFLGGLDSFPSLSFSRLVKGEYPAGFFRGKVVLIGVTGRNADRHGVALQALGAVPGVYIHAYLVRNLLEQSWLKYLPNWLFILVLLVTALCWTALFRNRSGSFLLLVTVGTGVFVTAAGVLAGIAGYVLPVVSLIGLFVFEAVFLLLRSYYRELEERRKIKTLFSRYVSPQILEKILQRRNEINTGGERRFVAVLFADIRDFMRFAEEHEPEEVVSYINQILGKMAEIVLRHGGLVDKFLGDGLLAVFGLPVWEEEMLEAVFAACREMVTAGKTRDGKNFAVGIGLAWGIVVAGSVGNPDRMEYTIIGAAVNLASRLEKLAGPGEIVFPFEPDRIYPLPSGSYSLEQVCIKGRNKPIIIGRIKGSGVG